MSDIENEKPRRRKKPAVAEDTFEHASLSDLITSASDAMNGLDDAAGVDASGASAGAVDASGAGDSAAELASTDNMIGDVSSADDASSESASSAANAGDDASGENADMAADSAMTDRLVSAIDWNPETEDMAFLEADGAESEAEMDANDAIVAQLSGTDTATDGRATDAHATDAALAAGAMTEESAEATGEPAAPADDFDERFAATGGKPLADVTDRSERLQELARLVAKTVSERKNDLDEVETPVEADGTMSPEQLEPEQMGFVALEEELDAADNDADPEPTEFVEADQLISIIESLLFSTDKPVSVATLKSLFKGTNVRTKDITRALDILASEYAAATRGVTLEEINGGYQLRTKVDNAEFLKRLQKVRPFRLSGPALETMAIVAYKQPVTKYEIDEIRGVESGHLLRALMERGLVQFQGKAEDKPGKPMAYGSTRKFLEIFGLRSLRELPTLSEIDELLPEGIGETEEKEKLSDITEELSNEFSGGYSDNEDELLKINDTLQAIDTTSEFFEQEKIRERERRDRDRAQDLRERIVLGEEVDVKDKRWLDRYEAKLHEAETQAGTTDGTPTTISADQIEQTESIGESLETLSAEKTEPTKDEDEAELEDLTSNLDWDDDAELEAEDTSNDV